MTPTETSERTMQALASRLRHLEAAAAARNTLARYMALCDQPCGDTGFPQLGDLFTEDAIWEGVGRRYAATFGRQAGRAAIVTFLNGYLAPSPHFLRNLHFLTSDQVDVAADGARVRGRWLMLQVSTYGSGTAEAISARLDIDFIQAADGRWLIAHFRTERLDCAPWPVAAGEVAA
ncbi:MAG: nuclear transport factor 2 family protein [Pseudomonadota bacterium]